MSLLDLRADKEREGWSAGEGRESERKGEWTKTGLALPSRTLRQYEGSACKEAGCRCEGKRGGCVDASLVLDIHAIDLHGNLVTGVSDG